MGRSDADQEGETRKPFPVLYPPFPGEDSVPALGHSGEARTGHRPGPLLCFAHKAG